MSRALDRLARARVPLGFAAAAALLALSHPTARSIAIGAPLAAAGEGLRLWAAGHLRKGEALAVSGPYRHIRHPLYAGSLLILAGSVVAAWTLWPGVGLVGAYLLVYPLVMRREQAELARAYGDAYGGYAASVPAVIPRFRPLLPASGRHSWSRVRKNREHKTVAGLVLVFVFFAVRAGWSAWFGP